MRTHGAPIVLSALLIVAMRASGAPAPRAVPEVMATVGETAVLRAQRWLPVPVGASVRWTVLRNPDIVEPIRSLETPADIDDSYGQRLRGWIEPPVTGTYRFWVAADDMAELRLSLDDTAGRARTVCRVTEWTPRRAYDHARGQGSAPIRLRKGQRYYFEALHVEGGGGDHLTVAWQQPGREREVVAGSALRQWTASGPGRRGAATREVWRGVSAATIADLLKDPRFAADSPLRSPISPSTLFAPKRAGRYRFRLEVQARGRRTSTQVLAWAVDPLRNGGAELASGKTAAAWRPSGDTRSAVLAWEHSSGVGGSRCLSIASRDPSRPANAVWQQTLTLAPYTAYLLQGKLRTQAVSGKGKFGAAIGVTMWKAENGCAPGAGDMGWTPFKVDFVTGPSGHVDVYLKLGGESEPSVGKVWFDDIELARNGDVETFENDFFVLHLYRDQIATIGRANVLAQMRRVQAVGEAYIELTGYTPGSSKQSAWSPRHWTIDALGWSGNPVLWYADPQRLATDWRRDPFCAEVFGHELAHNWDHESYTFHGHFNELKMAYAYETRNLGMAEDGWRVGPGTRNRYEVRMLPAIARGEIHEGAQIYKNLLIRDKAGWEPFKRVFRWFLSLPPESVPRTPWDKFKVWHDKLSEFSGFDAWSVYTPEEIAYVRAYYTPQPDPKPLSAFGADTTSIELNRVAWESAEVGWDRPHYGIHLSGTRAYANALYAHAPSRFVFQTGGAWRRFEGSYGLVRGAPGSVVFIVRGDGRELWRSERVADASERAVSLDISGVQALELIVDDAGNGRNSDSGVWFGPVLRR